MLQTEPVDLLDLRPLDIATDRERLVPTLKGKHDRLGHAREGHRRRQADVAEMHVLTWQLDLAGLHDQHIRSLGDILCRQV